MSNQQLALGFLLNFAAALVIVRGIYYPIQRLQEYVFAFFAFNTVVFLIASLLGGINGPIDMTGGVVLINGPTANNNGALDYAGAFNLSGGFLVAVGSAGMAQAPSPSSTQYSVAHTFSSPQAGGTIVHVETEDGREILTFVPTKAYQSVVFSSPELENGETYVIYSGGNSTGTVTNSLYLGGAYTPGTQVASLTIAGMVTGAGGAWGGFPRGPGGGMRPPGGGRR